MSRTILLIGLLVLATAASWFVAFYFYNSESLPGRIPLNAFDSRPFSWSGPKEFVFFFPAVCTGVAAVVLLFYPVRGALVFFGRKRVARLAVEFQVVIIERAYQVVLVLGTIICLFFTFMGLSLALYACSNDPGARINSWPLLAALVVMALYVLFNYFLINRMIGAAEQASEEEQEES